VAATLNRPESVTIVDVSPRDGLQNEAGNISSEAKIALVNGLTRAGVPRIEVTSFVSPKAVPQMADAEAVVAGIERKPGVEYAALVANVRGLERALPAKLDIINVVVVATETFNQRNANRSVAESVQQAIEIRRATLGAGARATVVVGAAFDCPFEGIVSAERTLSLVEQFANAGFEEITLADTIGTVDPARASERTMQARERFPNVSFGLHLHDTRGMGLANAVAFLQAGGNRLEASLGGIGGCPFAPGATGNASTEDLVYMLESMGCRTGIDIPTLIETAVGLRKALGRDLPSNQLRLADAAAAS
jgi:hydroxymethylglutaryl-CoA lyase